MVEPEPELARRMPFLSSRIDRPSPDMSVAASAGFRERVLLQRFGRLRSDGALSQVRPLFERGERRLSNHRFLSPLAHSPASRCFGKLEKSRVLCQGSPSWWWASCAVVSLVEGSVCVASAFSIATDKLVGDCDMVPSTSASFTPALEAEIRGARQA